MPRRRGGNGDTAEEPTETVEATQETAAPAEPKITVRMEGTAEAVKKQLGVAAAEAKPEEKKPPATPAEDMEAFSKLLRNPKYIVKVKRLRPKQWKGAKIAVEVFSSELPLQWEEIKSEVDEVAKGGTYKVSVINESGNLVDARNFEIDGEPLIKEAELTPEEKQIFGGGTTPPDAIEQEIANLDRRAIVSSKLLEVERIEEQLKEARDQRNGGKKKDFSDSDLRIASLEKNLIEAKHQAELEARDRKHAEEMKELRNLILQGQKPAAPQGPSEISLILQQMQKNQEASERRFELMQKQMHDDKQSQMLEELRALRNKPQQQQGGMLEMAETMLKLRKVFGWGGDDGDDGDDDDKDDDRPWWERALDRLGDKITPKLVDKIFDKLDGLEKGGKTVDRDEFLRTVEEEKKKEDELVRLATEQAIAKIEKTPVKVIEQKPAEKVPVVNVMERKVVGEEKPSETAPSPAAPDASAPAPAPAQDKASQDQLEIKKQVCQRVAGVIMMLESELQQRPRQYDWNYEGCWKMLPEEILEKVCTAKTQADVFDAFKVEGINTEEVDKMKERVLANPRAAAWMSRGIRELNLWWLKLEKDPDFDPADEGEQEEESKEEETAL